jgi:subtilisin family serine protease
MGADGSLRASDYASGFMSTIYPGRRVPDLCGLVGLAPKATYIMLPVEPGCRIDAGCGGGAFPTGDQTGRNDGWACFSGTSAAAPQLAGVAALIREACPKLAPADVRDVMRRTAQDVDGGTCSAATGGHPATAGPDTATGEGLADACEAVLLARREYASHEERESEVLAGDPEATRRGGHRARAHHRREPRLVPRPGR